jgi:hypothetical protein
MAQGFAQGFARFPAPIEDEAATPAAEKITGPILSGRDAIC